MNAQLRTIKFDVLRVVAMLMIIGGHFVYHGIRHILCADIADVGFTASLTGKVNYVLCQFLGYATNIGPNLFVLITGYFLVKPRPVRYAVEKFFKLWSTIVFYSITLYFMALWMDIEEVFSFQSFFTTCLLPIHSNAYWFMTMYAGLLLLSPFLAQLSGILSQRDYQALLAVLLVLNFGQEAWGYGIRYSGGMSLFFYIFIFFIGGYIKLFQPRYNAWCACLVYFVTCAGLTAVNSLDFFILNPEQFPYTKAIANNSLTLFTSVAFFLWFISFPDAKLAPFRRCVTLSPFVLSVYLIHENTYVRTLLWDKMVCPSEYIDRWWLVPYGLVVCLAVFGCCIAIDYARHQILQAMKRVVARVF